MLKTLHTAIIQLKKTFKNSEFYKTWEREIIQKAYYQNLVRINLFAPLIIIILLPIIYIDIYRINQSVGDIRIGSEIILYAHLFFLALLLITILIIKKIHPGKPESIHKMHIYTTNGFIVLATFSMAAVTFGDVMVGNNIANYIGTVFFVAILFYLPYGRCLFNYTLNTGLLLFALGQVELDASNATSHIVNLLAFSGVAFALSRYLYYIEVKDQKREYEKNRFFSIIAHDLRAPFNTLIGFSDVMIDDFDEIDDSEKKELIESIRDISKGTFELLENLLSWSRSQTGRMQYDPQSYAIADIIGETVDLQRRVAQEKVIKIEQSIAVDSTVFADKDMLIVIIRNLLSNAIKFTPKGGEILISAKSMDDVTYIHIKDDGVGMNQKFSDNLFRIDHKITTLGTNNEKGSGLGLVLCKEFIEKNAGTISVKSSPGNGSTFTIKLPSGNSLLSA